MKRIFFVLLTGLMLIMAGCASNTVSVDARFMTGVSALTGKITGYAGDGGEIEISSPGGLSCNGPFTYVKPRHGEGTLTCSDGRTGQFSFVANGDSGTGKGIIGDEKILLTFGE